MLSKRMRSINDFHREAVRRWKSFSIISSPDDNSVAVSCFRGNAFPTHSSQLNIALKQAFVCVCRSPHLTQSLGEMLNLAHSLVSAPDPLRWIKRDEEKEMRKRGERRWKSSSLFLVILAFYLQFYYARRGMGSYSTFAWKANRLLLEPIFWLRTFCFKPSPRLLCRREQTKILLSRLRIFGERQTERVSQEAIFQLLKHSRMRIICWMALLALDTRHDDTIEIRAASFPMSRKWIFLLMDLSVVRLETDTSTI